MGILQLGFGVIEHIDLVSDFQSGHSELLLQFLFVFTLFDINEIIGIDINCSAVRLYYANSQNIIDILFVVCPEVKCIACFFFCHKLKFRKFFQCRPVIYLYQPTVEVCCMNLGCCLYGRCKNIGKHGDIKCYACLLFGIYPTVCGKNYS